MSPRPLRGSNTNRFHGEEASMDCTGNTFIMLQCFNLQSAPSRIPREHWEGEGFVFKPQYLGCLPTAPYQPNSVSPNPQTPDPDANLITSLPTPLLSRFDTTNADFVPTYKLKLPPYPDSGQTPLTVVLVQLGGLREKKTRLIACGIREFSGVQLITLCDYAVAFVSCDREENKNGRNRSKLKRESTFVEAQKDCNVRVRVFVVPSRFSKPYPRPPPSQTPFLHVKRVLLRYRDSCRD